MREPPNETFADIDGLRPGRWLKMHHILCSFNLADPVIQT